MVTRFQTSLASSKHLSRVLDEVTSHDYMSMMIFIFAICALVELLVSGLFLGLFFLTFSAANFVWFYGFTVPVGPLILVGGSSIFVLVISAPFGAGLRTAIQDTRWRDRMPEELKLFIVTISALMIRIGLTYFFYKLIANTWNEGISPPTLRRNGDEVLGYIGSQTILLATMGLVLLPSALAKAVERLTEFARDQESKVEASTADDDATTLDERIRWLETYITSAGSKQLRLSQRSQLRVRKHSLAP